MSDADAKLLFRDNPEAIAHHLTDAFAQNELATVVTAIRQVLHAQNVKAFARENGLRRDGLYHTFSGKLDPNGCAPAAEAKAAAPQTRPAY